MHEDTRQSGTAGSDLKTMAKLMREERERTVRAHLAPVRLINLLWGGAYLIGHLLMWAGLFPWAAAVFAVAILGTLLVSFRIGAGTRGGSSRAGKMYSWSWVIALLATWLHGQALAAGSGLGGTMLAPYYATAFPCTVGLCLLVGAAVWRSWLQFTQGVVMMVIVIVAGLIGMPTGYLILAIGGGGLFFLIAACMRMGADA